MLLKADMVFAQMAHQPICPQSGSSTRRVLQNVFEMGKCLAKYTFVNSHRHMPN